MTEPSNKGEKGPLLAKKGTAQPLTRPADAKQEEAPNEASGPGPEPWQEPPAPEETNAGKAAGDTPPEKPAATLLDHPLDLAKFAVFGGPRKGPKKPVQSTLAARAGGASPEIGGGQRHDPSEAPGPEAAGATPGGSEGEARRRRAALASWVREGGRSGRSGRRHWPVAVGALLGAVALIALVESGTMPFGDEDSEPPQPAEQSQAAPSPESAAAGVQPEGLPAAPASTAGEAGQAPDVTAALSETEPAVPAEVPVLAVPPDPIRQAIADLERDPIVDFIRLDPAGKAVVAGRASPGTELVILDNGAQLGRATADIYGLWTFISDAPLPSGRHEIALALESQGRLTILPRAGPAVASPEPQRPAEPAEEIGIEVAAGPAATLAEAQPPSEPAEAATAAQSPAEMPEESTAAAAASAIDAPAIDAPPQPAPKPARAAAPQVAAATPAAGSFAVQFISLSTPNAAQRAQGDLEKRFPDLLAGLEMFIDRTTLSDNRVVYRVRTGPFGSRADAQAACARFKTRGQDCLVARR